jgi:hypothetical protein
VFIGGACGVRVAAGAGGYVGAGAESLMHSRNCISPASFPSLHLSGNHVSTTSVFTSLQGTLMRPMVGFQKVSSITFRKRKSRDRCSSCFSNFASHFT